MCDANRGFRWAHLLLIASAEQPHLPLDRLEDSLDQTLPEFQVNKLGNNMK